MSLDITAIIIDDDKDTVEPMMEYTTELSNTTNSPMMVPPAMMEILLQTFNDLREVSKEASNDDERLESALSTAEQICVLEDAVLHSHFFGEAKIKGDTLAQSLVGSLVRRKPEDVSILNE